MTGAPGHDYAAGQLVSVVMPVFNAATMLERAVSSVTSQTHAQLQLVLVDDGSTDASAGLCDALAAEDGRIVVLHQRNAGPSAARNAGLEAAQGDWLAFVDADDWIEPGYISALLWLAQGREADVVVSDASMEESGGPRRFGMVVPDTVFSSRDELWEAFLGDRIPWSLWGKLYRSSLFADVRLDTGIYIAEDLDANARILARPGLRVATSSNAGYHYRVEEGSVDHSFSERHLCQLDVFAWLVDFVREEGIRTRTRPEVFYEQRVLNCVRKAIDAHVLTPATKRVLGAAIARHRDAVLADPDAPRALKLRMLASRFGVGFYAMLNRIYTSR